MVATYPERAKVLNIRHDGNVSLCVLSDDFGGAWVQVDGMATIVDLPEAMDDLIDYYRSAAGEHPDWDEYRAAMERQEKCIIRIEITGWGPVATGGFPSSKKDDVREMAAGWGIRGRLSAFTSDVRRLKVLMYDLIIIGGTSSGLSVAISSLRSGINLVRVIESGPAVAFPELAAENELDIGFGESVTSIDKVGDDLVVTTNRLAYRTKAALVALRPEDPSWVPTMPSPTAIGFASIDCPTA